MRLTKAQLKALQFVACHPGGKVRRAFPCSFTWQFNAPELKRSPCKPQTLTALLAAGALEINWGHRGSDAEGAVLLTVAGVEALRSSP